MPKLIAAINMTLDGFCDHTAVTPDQEIHRHYSDLLKTAQSILYGRITYQLMEYWRDILENPTGDKSKDDFAKAIDEVPKYVFSRTLESVDWATSKLMPGDLDSTIAELKSGESQDGKSIFVGSPGLIIQLLNLRRIDELQLCIHPVIAAGGKPLFNNINERLELRLKRSKTFSCGAVIHYYQPIYL